MKTHYLSGSMIYSYPIDVIDALFETFSMKSCEVFVWSKSKRKRRYINILQPSFLSDTSFQRQLLFNPPPFVQMHNSVEFFANIQILFLKCKFTCFFSVFKHYLTYYLTDSYVLIVETSTYCCVVSRAFVI